MFRLAMGNTHMTVCERDCESKLLTTPPTLSVSGPEPSQFTLSDAKPL